MNSKMHNIRNCVFVGVDRVCMSFFQLTGCTNTAKQSEHQAKEQNLSEFIQENYPQASTSIAVCT
jgi:hypothetical protein